MIAVLAVATVSVILWDGQVSKPHSTQNTANIEQTQEQTQATQSEEGQSQQPIGGQTDDKGCLTPAGYAFDETIGACARSFELTDVAQIKAAAAAVSAIGFTNGMTVISVAKQKAAGTYIVKLEKKQQTGKLIIEATVKNGKVTSLLTSPGK